MANIIKIKQSAVPSRVPTTSDLALGELGVNTYDGKLYAKKDNGVVSIIEIGAAGSFSTSGNIEGGVGNSIYLLTQNLDSGVANNIYLTIQIVSGGNALGV